MTHNPKHTRSFERLSPLEHHVASLSLAEQNALWNEAMAYRNATVISDDSITRTLAATFLPHVPVALALGYVFDALNSWLAWTYLQSDATQILLELHANRTRRSDLEDDEQLAGMLERVGSPHNLQ